MQSSTRSLPLERATAPAPTVSNHLDLFGSPVVPGLSYRSDFLTAAEEYAFIKQLDDVNLTPFRFHQWTGKRVTQSYGWSYDFERGTFAKADPIPEWLGDVKARAAQFAALEPDDLVQTLLIRYDPGAGIGWHRDRPVFEHVVGISLGNPATLRLRRRRDAGFDRASIAIAPRSIYHLCGDVRHIWEHSIAPMDVPRWSITFRSLAAGTLAGA